MHFGPSHAATRELVSSVYVRSFTAHIIQQFANAQGGRIGDGDTFVESEKTKFRSFGVTDAFKGFINGIDVGDVVGGFTEYAKVLASNGVLTFTAVTVMGLRSFYGGNKLGTNVKGPSSGAFSDFTQVFTWQTAVPI